MGSCWSSKTKAPKSPSHIGLDLFHGVKQGNEVIASCSRMPSASNLQTSQAEGEILQQSSNLKSFSFKELKIATRNFHSDRVLGKGRFGCVFKGWIDEQTYKAVKPGIGLEIAIKKLNGKRLQGHQEWLVKINFLGQLYHPNLVKLIGYCLDGKHQLLVCEFMPRGSLDNHLFIERPCPHPLSWKLRLKVALGAAKGLAFLHSDQVKLMYKDFKTSHILLDLNYDAKLSTFGLVKDGPQDSKSHMPPTIFNVYNYEAPESAYLGVLTTKSNVYSFGLVLLEMLCGQRVVGKDRPSGEQDLLEWAKQFLTSKRRIFHFMDARIQGQYSVTGAIKAVKLTCKCLSKEPKPRPSMNNIVEALEQLQVSEETTTNDIQQNIRLNPTNRPT